MVAATSLFPVLGLDPRDITGIQQSRVCVTIDVFSSQGLGMTGFL
jgi:hypothetical protein